MPSPTDLPANVRRLVDEIENEIGETVLAADDIAGEVSRDGGAGNGKVESAVREILLEIGDDPDREGLLGTPERVHRMYTELTAGYHVDPDRLINGAIFEVGYSEMVVVKDIPFYSLCEHHLLPFFGTAAVAYIPRGRVMGLSKIPRVVEMYARRLQIQERLTQQIADFLQTRLEPQGVGVVHGGDPPLCGDARRPQAGHDHDDLVGPRPLPLPRPDPRRVLRPPRPSRARRLTPGAYGQPRPTTSIVFDAADDLDVVAVLRSRPSPAIRRSSCRPSGRGASRRSAICAGPADDSSARTGTVGRSLDADRARAADDPDRRLAARRPELQLDPLGCRRQLEPRQVSTSRRSASTRWTPPTISIAQGIAVFRAIVAFRFRQSNGRPRYWTMTRPSRRRTCGVAPFELRPIELGGCPSGAQADLGQARSDEQSSARQATQRRGVLGRASLADPASGCSRSVVASSRVICSMRVRKSPISSSWASVYSPDLLRSGLTDPAERRLDRGDLLGDDLDDDPAPVGRVGDPADVAGLLEPVDDAGDGAARQPGQLGEPAGGCGSELHQRLERLDVGLGQAEADRHGLAEERALDVDAAKRADDRIRCCRGSWLDISSCVGNYLHCADNDPCC